MISVEHLSSLLADVIQKIETQRSVEEYDPEFPEYVPQRDPVDVFVCNIPFDCSESEFVNLLKSHSSAFCNVRIKTETKKRYAFVQMSSSFHAQKLIRRLNGVSFHSRKLGVFMANQNKKK